MGKEKNIRSIDTDYTITLVRNAIVKNESFIVGNTFEGRILFYNYQGKKLWDNTLSGFANHDIWCEDITNDGKDEIFAANADGFLYCLDAKGKLLWKFKSGETPLIGVTVMTGKQGKYIVTGGMDMNVYFLDTKGNILQTLNSKEYSITKAWGKKNGKRYPKGKAHTTNFLRKATIEGKEVLVMHGTNNQNATSGAIYLFNVDEYKPYKSIKVSGKSVIGDLKIFDVDKDGTQELYMGSSGMIQEARVEKLDLKDETNYTFKISKQIKRGKTGFGYRVPQTVLIKEGKTEKLLTIFGERIFLLPTDMQGNTSEVLISKYSYNDLWKDESNEKLLLASAQSGGSCIHIINTASKNWREEYIQLSPKGKLERMLNNTADFRKNLQKFNASKWDGKGQDVYFMTEKINEQNEALVKRLNKKNESPYFLNSIHMPKVENWDRSTFGNEAYANRFDRRKKYTLSQQQMVDLVTPLYDGYSGISYWGGHGNDPMMISLETEKKIIDAGKGKKVVMIFPELEHYTTDFDYTLKNFLYPLADYANGKNANLYIRTKHTFWQAIIYLDMWNGLLSGEYADVFVPSMEETTDKMMDLSVAGKMGIWTSGATNSWGARGARDNASYFRLRQHSHQMVPNHFLRMLVYSMASGAQYINNFPVNQEYMSVLYEMVEKGVLYIPKRDQIVSINPVHLSMTTPDKVYLDQGNNCKWTTFYDKEFEAENALVFSRMNGTWPAAPVKEYDFSAYASGSKERRLEFVPRYHQGLVMITPPQKGKFADKEAKRGALEDLLHPIYKGNMTEFITDGKYYYSSDGTQKYAPQEYYTEVQNAIEKASDKLPVKIKSGEVGWVAVQTSPKHIRLTIIDNGYINPDDRLAEILLQVEVEEIKDIVTNETLKAANGKLKLTVPCGLFRFIDIQLKEELK